MLPWRRHDVRLLPFTRSPDELLEATERALRAERIDLVAVTGASNVTGEVWPVAELAELAHEHGAELFVDAAQLAPHRAIDMARAGIDHLAFSGHKLYAPFGPARWSAGCATASRCWPAAARSSSSRSTTSPGRPRPTASRRARRTWSAWWRWRPRAAALLALGMDAVAAHERSLAVRLWTGWRRVPGLELLTQWAPGSRRPRRRRHLQPRRLPRSAAGRDPQRRARDRRPPRLLLRAPADDAPARRAGRRGERFHAELRAGRRRPAGRRARQPRARRPRPEDVDRLVGALREIAAYGPRSRYVHVPEHDEYRAASG